MRYVTNVHFAGHFLHFNKAALINTWYNNNHYFQLYDFWFDTCIKTSVVQQIENKKTSVGMMASLSNNFQCQPLSKRKETILGEVITKEVNTAVGKVV